MAYHVGFIHTPEGVGFRLATAVNSKYSGETPGEGEIKPSAFTGENRERIYDLWTTLFEKLHEHDVFEVKILASSCAYRTITFSLDQLMTISNGGKALSGKKAPLYREMLAKATAEEYPFVDAAESTELSGHDLLSPELLAQPAVRVLDVVLTLRTETIRPGMVASVVDLDETEVKDILNVLKDHGIVEERYEGLWRPNTTNSAFKELSQVHTELYQEAGVDLTLGYDDA